MSSSWGAMGFEIAGGFGLSKGVGTKKLRKGRVKWATKIRTEIN